MPTPSAASVPEPPAGTPHSLVLLLAVACALSVASVYYAQPLLDAIGREFGMAEGAVGVVVTATQLGCALALGVLVLDVAMQALYVTNQTMIFSISAEAHSRLVGGYMMFYAAGSGLGSIAATSVYAQAGWLGVCALGGGISLAALLFRAATLPRGVNARLARP